MQPFSTDPCFLEETVQHVSAFWWWNQMTSHQKTFHEVGKEPRLQGMNPSLVIVRGPSCMKNPSGCRISTASKGSRCQFVTLEQQDLGEFWGKLVVGCFGYNLMMPSTSYLIKWVRKFRFESPNSWNSKTWNIMNSCEIKTLKDRRSEIILPRKLTRPPEKVVFGRRSFPVEMALFKGHWFIFFEAVHLLEL